MVLAPNRQGIVTNVDAWRHKLSQGHNELTYHKIFSEAVP